jgi:hypothetical protein
MESARLLDSGLSTTELDNKYRDLMPAFMIATESDDWCLIDGEGNETSILAPNFQADGGIVWRWS